MLPTGQKFDPASDKTFLFSLGVFEPFGELLLINGQPQPAPFRLVTGTKYRFRLINISPDNARMRASLRKAGTPVQWRIVAKDGADLPPAAATSLLEGLGCNRPLICSRGHALAPVFGDEYVPGSTANLPMQSESSV